MNLELLDPFRRQIPDRVDSTLNLPAALHKPPPKAEEDPEWKASYHLSFNRRGTYLAVGHATGTVAVHDFLSRTLSAVYSHQSKEDVESGNVVKYANGVTSVTWSRRSRSLLAGAVGDSHIRLIDTTHPFGPEECCFVAPLTNDKGDNDDEDDQPRGRVNRGSIVGTTGVEKPLVTLFKEPKSQILYTKTARKLSVKIIGTTTKTPSKLPFQDEEFGDVAERFPVASFQLPAAVGGSLQIHPKDNTTGLAVLSTGELVLFRAPDNVWSKKRDEQEEEPVLKVVTIYKADTVTSAAFSHIGDRIFLATKSGGLIGLDIGHTLYCLCTLAETVPAPEVEFTVNVGSNAWHLLVSRNGKYLLLNCADGALRLYNTQDCVEAKDGEKPKPKVFQDLVSKERFVCCDFSGDGEYIVGGCNGVRDDKYELYLWNTATGALMDRLTGAPVSLYSVAWHPTRSFLAVATSDGLVDVWGPRMDWTAFAPDFQALPMNVEYVEQEDEFDIAVEDNEKSAGGEDELVKIVDVNSVEPVPVFASDSESESEVFKFETKMNNLMYGRGRNRVDGKHGNDDKD